MAVPKVSAVPTVKKEKTKGYDSREAASRVWEQQMEFLGAKEKKEKEDALFASLTENTYFGGPLRNVPGDDRALRVLAQLYDDPIIKAFIEASKLSPAIGR